MKFGVVCTTVTVVIENELINSVRPLDKKNVGMEQYKNILTVTEPPPLLSVEFDRRKN